VDEPEVGQRVGGYVLEQELGRGAMGVVYRAVRDDGAVVALKLAPADLLQNETYRRRFEREGSIASSLTHRNIVEVVETGVADGRPFVASRIVEGSTLADLLATDGPLDDAGAVRLVSQVAAALDVLHERDLIHRDVKPANVIVRRDGSAALADFGLARGVADTILTSPGRVSGTVDYLAPEVIRGEPATPASDLYSLGCLAYECLDGAAPFSDRPVADALLAHLEEQPRLLLSPLSGAVVQALAKDPRDRPPTAAAYALMLRVSLLEAVE
jgi:serine/threonine-protein kinase